MSNPQSLMGPPSTPRTRRQTSPCPPPSEALGTNTGLSRAAPTSLAAQPSDRPISLPRFGWRDSGGFETQVERVPRNASRVISAWPSPFAVSTEKSELPEYDPPGSRWIVHVARVSLSCPTAREESRRRRASCDARDGEEFPTAPFAPSFGRRGRPQHTLALGRNSSTAMTRQRSERRLSCSEPFKQGARTRLFPAC